MKKLLILLAFFITLPVFALEDVGIAKYAVLETTCDNAPIRSSDNENAFRLSELYKDTVLFADKQNENYYRVELKEGEFGWVNKRQVEVQAIIPEKRIDNIEKLSFKEDKNSYNVEIKTPFQSAFLIEENNQNLDFTLFDNRYDPIETRISGKNEVFLYDKDNMSSELNLYYKTNKPLFGYKVQKTDKGYVYSIKKAPNISKRRPLKAITVVVNPGHGGNEKGACAFGLEEKTLNLQISKRLRRELKKRGAKVYLTRKKDVRVGLYDRTAFANEKKADILLSIHQNSLANLKDIANKYGVGTYYYHQQSKPLAKAIQKNLVQMTGFYDDKVNYASLALTRPTGQISVLVECGYIIRKEEAQKLANKKFQKVVARAIVKGCEEYLRESFL